MRTSIEFDLLCSIARPEPDLARALDIIAAGIDFDELSRLAAEHALWPQLIRSLDGQPALPPALRTAIDTYRRGHLVRMATLSGSPARLAEALEANNVPFAAFKGATAAVLLYGDLAARQYNDIDIVVPESSVDDAEHVLAGLGYRGAQGDAPFRRAFLGHLRQFAFERDGLEATVDLHWDFVGAHLPFPLGPEDVWSQTIAVAVGTCVVPAVAGKNLALLLAGHGTKEGWRSLGWVRDFSMMIVRYPELDWAKIHRAADVRGCGHCVLLGCALALALLDVPVPPALAEPLSRAGSVKARAQRMIDQMREGKPAATRQPNFSDFGLSDRLGGRLKGVLTLLFARSAGDYLALPLPRALWGAYYVIRPFRLAAKAMGGFLHVR